MNGSDNIQGTQFYEFRAALQILNSDQNKSKFTFKSMNDRKYLDQQYLIKTKIQNQRLP